MQPRGPYQAPLSMGFSRQEYWSGLPFPFPGDLPDPGIEPGSPALQADALTSEPPGKPREYCRPPQFMESPTLQKHTHTGCFLRWLPLLEMPFSYFSIQEAPTHPSRPHSDDTSSEKPSVISWAEDMVFLACFSLGFSPWLLATGLHTMVHGSDPACPLVW